MGHSFVQMHMHIVWATVSRRPLIDGDRRAIVHRALAFEAKRLSVQILAIGGVTDHIHMLVSVPPMISISYLVKQLKGVSSLDCGPAFRWQPGYAAISVSRRDVGRVVDYINNQEAHHNAARLIGSLERTG